MTIYILSPKIIANSKLKFKVLNIWIKQFCFDFYYYSSKIEL